MAGISFDNVTKFYGEFCAVRDLDLEIRDGEFFVLVGPSGCGKSTILRMVAGLETISEGTVRIGDRAINRLPPGKRNVSMVFQNYALFPHLTVYKNIAFGLKIRRTPRDDIDRLVREAAETLGLTEQLDKHPRELSGGQRQRAAVGRALVRHPDVFLFDEPLSNLDAKLRTTMRAELLNLHQRLRTTMIYVTHDQIEAMTLGDRICVLDRGVVQQVSTPNRIYQHPANTFVASFIGSPPMNILPGTLTGGNDTLKIQLENGVSLDVDVRSTSLDNSGAANRRVYAGIRPSALVPTAVEKDTGILKGTVDVAELIGEQKYVHFKVGDHKVVATVDAGAAVDTGDDCRFEADPASIRLFDAEGRSMEANSNKEEEL